MHIVAVKRSALLTAVALVLGLVASLLAVAGTGAAVVFNNQTTRKLPIYCVNTDEKVVALSFDAAWGADRTQSILDTLTEFDVSANYFVVEFWVEKYPEMLKTLSDSGRVEIGTHSKTHPNMSELSREGMKAELTSSVAAIENITGKTVELFRPPFGDYNDALIEECAALNLYPIQWDVDSLDWKGLSSAEIAARVVNGVKPGSIVLMHNDGAHTAEALPAIIQSLKGAGYTFKTIGELIYRDGYTIDHTGKQCKN